MRELLDQMARASYEVHAAADPALDVAWEELSPERREVFRRAVSASLDAAVLALSHAGSRGQSPESELTKLKAAIDERLRDATVAAGPGKPRQKVGPEDEERGQQAGELPFNQRDD